MLSTAVTVCEARNNNNELQCCRSVDFTPCSAEVYMVFVTKRGFHILRILWTFLWILELYIYGLTKSTNYLINN